MTTVTDVITDEHLLGPDFCGPSWGAWKITLKAIFGEPMTVSEADWFRSTAQREPPPGRVREAWLAVGRRGGKDSAISAIATHAAVFGDFKRHLRPGERAVILCVAATKDQAAGILGYIAAFFDGHIPVLAPLVKKITDDAIELTTGVDIVVATNSHRSIRGRTVALAIFNELAFWRDERFSSPDTEVYSAVLPSLMTLRKAGSILIGISSVHRKMGLLYDKVQQYHGKDDPNVLAIIAPTVAYNPTIDQADIDLDMALDPDKARAEFLSEWRTDISTFVDRSIVERLIDRGVRERPYDPAIGNYFAFADEAGGGADASTLAICHKARDGTIVQDVIRIIKAPFSPAEAIAEKCSVLKEFRLTTVISDHWAGGLRPEMYRVHGVRCEQSAKPKSQIYIDFLHILNSSQLLMLDEPLQISELCNLERRVAWGGKESVDHPQSAGSSDDAINSLAGAAVLAAGEPVDDLMALWAALAAPAGQSGVVYDEWMARERGEPIAVKKTVDPAVAEADLPIGPIIAPVAAPAPEPPPQPMARPAPINLVLGPGNRAQQFDLGGSGGIGYDGISLARLRQK